MLFNSYVFLFIYLPVALAAFYALRSYGRLRDSVLFLAFASVAFYAYWNPPDTVILIATVVFNYFVARSMSTAEARTAKALLFVGIVGNLGLLLYFKYFAFLMTVLGFRAGTYIATGPGVIGISFFTFTQLAYLVDCYKSRTHEEKFGNYALFVTIFPHLIAGPIIHHAQMRPQFERLRTGTIDSRMVLMGVIIFVIGLAKKVLLADNLVGGADTVFNAADAGMALSTSAAWLGTVAYTLQIYFDFSGYSDMAIGLALLFGLRLPLNFDSPYKSTSIIEFWRRWHMTLSAWLRDYLYIPLGGNRGGEFGRLRNVFITFLLGGIWHGAGWTFVIWGALHGAYVVINHLLRKGANVADPAAVPMPVKISKQAITLLVVMIAWVFFRAKTPAGALAVLKSMAFLGPEAGHVPVGDGTTLFWIALAAAIALAAPATHQLTGYTPKLSEPLQPDRGPLLSSIRAGVVRLGASPAAAVICGVLFAGALAVIWRPAIFIYFNF